MVVLELTLTEMNVHGYKRLVDLLGLTALHAPALFSDHRNHKSCRFKSCSLNHNLRGLHKATLHEAETASSSAIHKKSEYIKLWYAIKMRRL